MDFRKRLTEEEKRAFMYELMAGGGSAVRIGPWTAPIEAAALGDSYVGAVGGVALNRHDYRGVFFWGNNALNGAFRFRPEGVDGVVGDTIEQTYSRLPNILALSPRPKVCFLSSLGSNDSAFNVPLATSADYANRIVNELNAAGIKPIAGTVISRDVSSAPQIAATAALNAMWAAMGASGRIIWCDWYAETVNSGTGYALPGIFFDGTHTGAKGGFTIGQVYASKLAPYVIGKAAIPITGDEGLLGATALMPGTGGTLGSNFTGSLFTGGATFGATETAGTKVLSKVARTAGGEWQQITFTGVVDAADVNYRSGVSRVISTSGVGLLAGDLAEAIVDYEIDPGATNMAGVYLAQLENAGAGAATFEWCGANATDTTTPDWGASVVRGVVRGRPFPIRTDVGTDTITVRVGIQGDGTAVGGITGTLRVAFTVRKIV